MQILKKIIIAYFICSFTSAVAFAASIPYHEGDSGKEIAEIQVKLKEQGYYLKAIDGQFTKETSKSVKSFQKMKKLKPDGIVDEKTYLLLVGRGENRVGKEAKIIETALQLVGVPYKWGGATLKGFDCSGFVWYVFDKNAVRLPRTADVQYKTGKAVARGNLQQGDLVFFTTYEQGPSHSGIYLGKGKFVHASSSRGVMVSHLTDSYWNTRYYGGRRIF